MKKLLITALISTMFYPSLVEANNIDLEIGGFYRGYKAYTDNDDKAGNSSRKFDFRDDVEIHFSGKTALNDELTIGVHGEIELGENSNRSDLDKIYAYFSGGWGRINFGHEDGAGYLLQVGTPAADYVVDGPRSYFQSFKVDYAGGSTIPNGFSKKLDYGMDFGKDSAKLTYITPKFNGFQAGFSFTPAVDDGILSIGNGTNPVATDEDEGEYENLWEIAVRWDKKIDNFKISLGAGYLDASTELNNTAIIGSDDRSSWNLGSKFYVDNFSFGIVYLMDDYGQKAGSGDGQKTWQVGLGWDSKKYHLGTSYYKSNYEYGNAANQDFDFSRLTFGGYYKYAAGLSWHGSVSFASIDDNAAPTNNRDVTQILLGSQIQF